MTVTSVMMLISYLLLQLVDVMGTQKPTEKHLLVLFCFINFIKLDFMPALTIS